MMSAAAATTTRSRLEALLEEARTRARATGRPVLVSVAERMPAVDPLEALAAVNRAARERKDLAALLAPGPAYWSEPGGARSIAGLGAAATLTAAGTGRFVAIDDAWSSLLADAVIEDPSGGVAGTGPLLIGGFAFDPAGSVGGVWDGFPDAALVLPRVQVVRAGDACWMTTNWRVMADGALDVDPEALAILREHVIDAARAGAVAPSARGGPAAPVIFSDIRSADAWRGDVSAATAEIRAGHMDKVVLARAGHAVAGHALDVIDILRHLRAHHPTTYVFGFWRGDRAFVGATPERLVHLEGRTVQSSSLAGSSRRGTSAGEDASLAAALLGSAKDRAEHELVRSTLCEALAEVCDEVMAPTVPEILTLPHVHHLHTAVRARLRAGQSLLALVGRLHPTPAVGGTPRGAALRFIREHEQLDRGWYAGPVGWLGRDRGEFAVALRSAVIAGREAWLFAGCGIVAESDPAQEFEESALKMRPMQQALGAAASA
jgi:isochorismate synthase